MKCKTGLFNKQGERINPLGIMMPPVCIFQPLDGAQHPLGTPGTLHIDLPLATAQSDSSFLGKTPNLVWIKKNEGKR